MCRLRFGAPITAARESVRGGDRSLARPNVANGKLVTSFTAFQPRHVRGEAGRRTSRKVAAVDSQPVRLSYDLATASNDDTKSAGGFDRPKAAPFQPKCCPPSWTSAAVKFNLVPPGPGLRTQWWPGARRSRYQPEKFNRVYVLAASADGDQQTTFRVGEKATDVTIQDWGGFHRTVGRPHLEGTEMTAERASSSARRWPGSPRIGIRLDGANEPYAYSYLFCVTRSMCRPALPA